MLAQIVSASLNSKSLISLNLENLITQYSKQIALSKTIAKIFVAVAILVVVPLGTQKINSEKYETAIKLDTASAFTLAGNDHQVSIETGVSKLDVGKTPKQSRIAYAVEPEGVENYIDLYKSAAAQYGIPWNVLAAVHYVESGASGSTNVTSYAGAQGPMQFMPGTWRAYGVDANGDGVADSHNVDDAIYGAANLLAAGGAAEGNVDAALFNYNHAQWYVDKVNDVANSIQ